MESPQELLSTPSFPSLLDETSKKIALNIKLEEARKKHPSNLTKHWNKEGKKFKVLAKMASKSLFYSIDCLKEVIAKTNTIEHAHLIGISLSDPQVMDSKNTSELIRKLMPIYSENVKDKYSDLFRTVSKPIEIIVGDLMMRQIKSEPEVNGFVVNVLYPFFYKLSKIILVEFLDNNIGITAPQVQKRFEVLGDEFYSKMSLFSQYIGSVPSLFRLNCYLLAQSLVDNPVVEKKLAERLEKDNTLDRDKTKEEIILGYLGVYLNIYMTTPTYLSFAQEFWELYFEGKASPENNINLVFTDKYLSDSFKKVRTIIEKLEELPKTDWRKQLEFLENSQNFKKDFLSFISNKENLALLKYFLNCSPLKNSGEEFIAFAFFTIYIPEIEKTLKETLIQQIRTLLGIIFEYPSLKASRDLIEGESQQNLAYKSSIELYKNELYSKLGIKNKENFLAFFKALATKDTALNSSQGLPPYLMPINTSTYPENKKSIKILNKLIKKAYHPKNREITLSKLLFASIGVSDIHTMKEIIKEAHKEKIELKTLLSLKKEEATLLYYAIQSGNMETISYLCHLLQQHSISVDEPSHCNITPLYLAASLNQSEIIGVLAQFGAKINSHNGESQITPLQAATRAGNNEAVNFILSLYSKSQDQNPDCIKDLDVSINITQKTQNALLYMTLIDFKNSLKLAKGNSHIVILSKLPPNNIEQKKSSESHQSDVFFKVLFRHDSKLNVRKERDEDRETFAKDIISQILQNKKSVNEFNGLIHNHPQITIQVIANELETALKEEHYKYTGGLKKILLETNSVFKDYDFFKTSIIEPLTNTSTPHGLFKDPTEKAEFILLLNNSGLNLSIS